MKEPAWLLHVAGIFAQLRQLGEPGDANVLTPEEFDSKKAELLARL
jgi:hypothetical protein